MSDQNDDVASRGRDTISKLPAADTLKETEPVQRSGSWNFLKFGSKADRSSSSPVASLDQGPAAVADLTDAGKFPAWQAVNSAHVCVGVSAMSKRHTCIQ